MITRKLPFTGLLTAIFGMAFCHPGFGQSFQRPFGPNSIWNRPIPSNAGYVASGLGALGAIANDREWIYQTNGNDPYHTVYQPEGYAKPGLNLPDYLIIPDEPNGAACFVLPDSSTLRQYNSFRRTSSGSDPVAYYLEDSSLYDSGIAGGHAGSGMSCIGGSIRQGEMASGNPLSHALKIELDWAVLYSTYSTSDNQNNTFRWPARNSDGNYVGYGGNTPNYTGTASALRMGSLCALPPGTNINNLGLSPYGLKIAQALKIYGAYVVDTTGDHYYFNNTGYTMSICIEEGEETDYFSADNQYRNTTLLYNDMAAIYPLLQVVDSNSDYSYAGVYRIINKAHNEALTATGDPYYSSYWSADLSGWTDTADSPVDGGTDEQYWSIVDAGNGYYRLVNWNHLTALDGTNDGYYSPYWGYVLSGWQSVATSPTTINIDEQLWSIQNQGNGYVRFVNKAHGTALNGTGDTYYSSNANSNISGWHNVADSPNSINSDEQQWQIQLMYSPK